MPKIRSWILVKVERISRDDLPVRVLPTSIDVGFFPLGATLRGVRILPKEETKDIIDPFVIEELEATISPWQLLQGRLRLTDVRIADSSLAVRVPATTKRSGPPLEGLFRILGLAPIHRLSLERIALRLKLTQPRAMDVDIGEINLTVEKKRGTLMLESTASSIYVLEVDSRANVRLDLEASLVASPKEVIVTALKVRRGDSFVVASGELSGDTEALEFKDLDVSLRSGLLLDSMRNWAVKSLSAATDLPSFEGRASVEAHLTREGGRPLKTAFKAGIDDFRMGKMLFGKVETTGSYRQNTLHLDKTKIDNPAGTLVLEDTVIDSAGTSITGQVTIPGFQVHELLKALGVGAIPVWMQTSGVFPCSGKWKPTFQLTCKGHARGENLLVRDSLNSKGTIAALRGFDADGEFTVDAEKVSYSTELRMPDSKGRSNGVIGYKTGFQIGYEADRLAIKDIANLSDLRIEGAAKIKGSTEGDSGHGTLAMNIDGTDLWFEDYWLGDTKAAVSYKSGLLSFQNIQGHYAVSRYNGDVKLDLRKKQINVAGRVPFFDAHDLLAAFSRRVKLPVALTGTGQAQVKVNGPLEFTKLSYDLKSSLFRGSIAGETFDQANFDVKAKSGEVTAERVQLTKGPAVVTLTGTGHPDGTVKTLIRGRGFRLEDTNSIGGTGLSLSGVVDFDMDLTGPVLSPDTDMRGTITKTSIGEQGVTDSNFRLKFTKRTIEGGVALLGDVLKADFILPLEASAPFALKLNSHDWNFAPVFAAVSGPGSRKDFEGRITSSIDIASLSGGFWNASGFVNVAKFSLSRGSLALHAPEPLALTLKNGQFRTQKFNLVGDNTFLKVTDSPSPVSKMDLQVNGKLDLSLLALMTPFFEDLRGMLSFVFNVRAGPSFSEILGSAYVEKGFLKFFDFPHAFEDIRADVLFNQQKIIFNSVKSEFGGGRLDASGGMEIKGYKNFPLNVTGSFDKITLNVPDKMKTTGSGQFTMTGNWFPFLLKGSYDIKEGLVTKEFGGENDENGGIRRSFFLPEFLLQDSFIPLLVDLQIDFKNGLAVKNSRINGSVTGSLSVKGNPTKPSILGSIATAPDTKLIFRDNEFEVTSANLQFTDPNEVNPRIYVAAQARVQDHDINLLVQGLASKPELLFSSVPSLPEKDITSLLALGVTDTKLSESVSSSQQASSTGQQVGSSLLSNNPLGKEIKDRFGIDLQFSPGFDDTTNTAVQKIIVSRQFNPKLGVTASRSLSNRVGETEAKVRYRLNERVSLVGTWQGRENEEITDVTAKVQQNPNRLGLDVEYKFEFK